MKIALYYNSFKTLGHSTRVYALLKAIRQNIRGSRIIVFEGGQPSKMFPLSKFAKVYQMPHSIDKNGLFIEDRIPVHDRMFLQGDPERMIRDRLGLMWDALCRFRPDIFVTEFYPFGYEYWTSELNRFLGPVRKELGCKIVGSSGYIGYVPKMFNVMKENYDRLLIHAPKEFAMDQLRYFAPAARAELKRVFKELKDRIDFTGFIFSMEKHRNVQRWRSEFLHGCYERLIFVSRGGGIVNKEIILAGILAARKRPRDAFVVCCGPSTTSEDMRSYNKLAKKIDNVKLLHALEPEVFDQYLSAADVSVSMTGYNTSLKLLHLRKRAVLVPYHTTEQAWRAEYLKRYIPAVVIPRKDLKAGNLVDAIDDALALSCPASRIPSEWFKGTRKTVEVFRGLA